MENSKMVAKSATTLCFYYHHVAITLNNSIIRYFSLEK